MKTKLAAILLLNQAKRAGYKDFPEHAMRDKSTKKVEKPAVGVDPKGNDNKAKLASERNAAKDLGFLKAALDLGLTGEKLNSFYKRAAAKLSQDGYTDDPAAVAARNEYMQRASSVGQTPKPATKPAPSKDAFTGYGLPAPSASAPAARR